MLSIVGMVVLRGQGLLSGVLLVLVWELRLSVVGPLLVLGIADRSLWVLWRRILTRVLRTIRLLGLVLRGLLGISVRGRSLVVWPRTSLGMVTSSASASMSATTSTIVIWRVLGVAACRSSRRRGRRRGVVVGHGASLIVLRDWRWRDDRFVTYRWEHWGFAMGGRWRLLQRLPQVLYGCGRAERGRVDADGCQRFSADWRRLANCLHSALDSG